MLTVRACPFPDVIEHATVQFPDVWFFEWLRGSHRSIVERPLPCLQNVQRFIFIQLAHGADAGNQLFGFFGANRRISVRVFVVEDEVHFDLPFRRRWTSSSSSWVAFSGFWSSSAMVCTTLFTSRAARSRAGCSASSAKEPDFGTNV